MRYTRFFHTFLMYLTSLKNPLNVFTIIPTVNISLILKIDSRWNLLTISESPSFAKFVPFINSHLFAWAFTFHIFWNIWNSFFSISFSHYHVSFLITFLWLSHFCYLRKFPLYTWIKFNEFFSGFLLLFFSGSILYHSAEDHDVFSLFVLTKFLNLSFLFYLPFSI